MTVNPPEKTEMEPIKTLPLGELKARWGGEEAGREAPPHTGLVPMLMKQRGGKANPSVSVW